MKAASRRPVAAAIFSIVLFEAAWCACIIAVAHGAPAWGIAALGVSIAWQLATSHNRTADLLLIAVAACTGLAWDTFLVQARLVDYTAHQPFAAVAPLWIVALWAQLGAVLREPLRWLHQRLWLAAMLGAVVGAAAYAGAARLGACSFADAPTALAALAIGWALLLPALLKVAHWQSRRAAATG